MRSTAITGYSSAYILVQSSGSVIRAARKTSMLKQSQVPFLKTPALKIRSSFKTKVFEDKLEGIICYRDENGEIICEGYDEGPRFYQQIPTTTDDPRDAEILNILLQRWIDIANNGESSKADNGGVTVKEDINGNSFHSFY